MPDPDDMRASRAPIFVMSDYRSGSTLLRYILDAHPDVCCPAQLRLAGFCQSAFTVIELLVEPDLGSRSGDPTIASVRWIVDQLMDSYCVRRGKARWCDKSPDNLDKVHMISSVFPDALYICLYRNCWDQIQSTLAHFGAAWYGRWPHPFGNDVIAAGVDRWCATTERLLSVEHEHRGRTCRVTYEEFVKRPAHETGRLMAFLGLSNVPGLPEAALTMEHSPGPADTMIRGTTSVRADRIGGGGRLSLTALPAAQRRRLNRLLSTLGYMSAADELPRDERLA